MPNETPDITIAIETCHLLPEEGVETLRRPLEAIARQTMQPDRHEVIAMVDPLRHPTLGAEITAAAPHVRIVECPSSHYYAQKNRAAREARAPIVGYVDSDCEPVPGWAEAIVEAFERHGEACAAVQGLYVTNDIETSAFAQAFIVTTFGNQFATSERKVMSIGASNSAFRCEELVARPFREDPVYHGPDVEKAAEIASVGRYTLLVPGAATSHDHMPGLRAQHFRGVYWGYCFLKLRRSGTGRPRYARLMRALGPLAPFAIVPGKAWIDLKKLVEVREGLGMGLGATLRCATLLAINTLSVGWGAMLCVAGSGVPEPPAWFFDKGHLEPARAAS